jgi:hypothetical protein
MAAHKSPQITKLSDGTADRITLDEVETIAVRLVSIPQT